MPRRRRPRHRLRTLLKVLLSLGLVLLLGEGMVRLAGLGRLPGYPPDMFVAAEPMAYHLSPHLDASMDGPAGPLALVTDGHGFRVPRGRTPASPEPPGRRVLVLGDSMTFGHGVEAEQAFPALLEERLSANGPTRVYNAGVPGHGTYNAVGMARALLPELRPDVVLHALFVGNDFRDNLVDRFGRLTARHGVLVALGAGTSDLGASARAALTVHSRLVSFVLQRLVALTFSPEEVVARLCADLDWGAGFGLATLRTAWEPDAHRAYGATVDGLQQLAALCDEAGVPLMVALLPGPLQYDDAHWAEAVQRCGLDPSAYDRERPNRQLAALGAADLGGVEVPVVDLLPVLRAATASGGERLYLDVHFSPAGHRVVAETLAPLLEPGGG